MRHPELLHAEGHVMGCYFLALELAGEQACSLILGGTPASFRPEPHYRMAERRFYGKLP